MSDSTKDSVFILPLLRQQTVVKEAVKQLSTRPIEGSRCHTIYFHINIDVRICPKNACSSIKSLFSMLMANRSEPIAQEYRIRKSIEYVRDGLIDPEENPRFFRTDATRVCVARDPVERAVSACIYLHRKILNERSPSMPQIIHFLDNFNVWDNTHLFTQSFYMGVPGMYDKVYKMNEVQSLQDMLKRQWGKKQGYEQHIEPIHTNQNGASYGVKTADVLEQLPASTVNRIKSMYQEDYNNGWHEFV